jgi:hypothetical protein
MKNEGPALESLLRRLAETPDDFLAEPRIGSAGKVHVAAVVHDWLASLGVQVPASTLKAFEVTDARTHRNRLSISLLLAWLLSSPWFRKPGFDATQALQALMEASQELSPYVASKKFVTEPDRREELARVALARLDLRPEGESMAQAQDRLVTISTAERLRVVKAAQAAEQRARAIREALAKKAAEESADKYTRE